MSTLLIHSEAAHEASPYAAPATMSDADYQALTKDLVTNGQYEPIVLHDDRVLTGRNIYRACVENGITPEFRQFGQDPDDGDDPGEFALRKNDRALSKAEADRLEDCEYIIERGLTTFVAVGNAMLEVRERKLWRGAYKSFEEWVETRFEVGRRQADRTIAASQVVVLLDGVEVKPRSEAVARELVPLRDEPGELQSAWTEVLVEHGERPTAAQTHEIVQRHLRDEDLPVIEATAKPAVQQGAPPTAEDYAAEAEAVKPDSVADAERDEMDAPDSKLDDWGDGDEGSSRKQDTAGVYTVTGFIDQVRQLPGSIALSERMTPDQKRHVAAGAPGAIKYLETLLAAIKTSST